MISESVLAPVSPEVKAIGYSKRINAAIDRIYENKTIHLSHNSSLNLINISKESRVSTVSINLYELLTPELKSKIKILRLKSQERTLKNSLQHFINNINQSESSQTLIDDWKKLQAKYRSLCLKLISENLPCHDIKSMITEAKKTFKAKSPSKQKNVCEIRPTDCINRQKLKKNHKQEYILCLKQALKRMETKGNLNTPQNSRITIQALCAEAGISSARLYSDSAYYAEIFSKCRTAEMQRRITMMSDALDSISANLEHYTNIKGFRLGFAVLMKMTGLSKDEFKWIELPMNDLQAKIQDTNIKLKKIRTKKKNIRFKKVQ